MQPNMLLQQYSKERKKTFSFTWARGSTVTAGSQKTKKEVLHSQKNIKKYKIV